MIVSLQVAAIAGLMAVASTPVMAQTTGTLPAQPPPYGVAPPPSQPPTTNQFSSNEIIDAGHRFFGGVSRGLAEIVEKAVSQWGLPNGGSAYFIGGFGMTALTANNIVVVPIRSGIGLRLGANLGYLKFTDTPTWNPFGFLRSA